MDRRGQGAMEFLFTYGFAMVAMLVAIAAISYFGILRAEKAAPTKCTFSLPTPCVDISIKPGTIDLAMRNSAGTAIQIEDYVQIDGCSSPVISSINGHAPPANISKGGIASISVSCGELSEGRFRSDVTLSYTNRQTGLTHFPTGTITGYVTG